MTEWWQWALAFFGAFMVGLSKTGIAGLGILNVAIFANIMPARESVGVVLIMLLSADTVAVAVYRREANWPQLLRLFPWAALGVIVGVFALGRVDDEAVRRLIGAILVVLIALQLLRRQNADAAPAPHPAFVIAAGLLAGFTTMVANAAGPIMILYLLAMRLPKLAFIGTTAWFFLSINLFKVPFSYGLGLINPGSFAVSLQLVPFAVIGALFGRKLIGYIDQKLFERLAMVLTLVAGFYLLFS
jgi:uncharacterized membrane protein YfcA